MTRARQEEADGEWRKARYFREAEEGAVGFGLEKYLRAAGKLG
jgi:hypothetical protein